MKSTTIVIIAFILSLTFTASESGNGEGNKPDNRIVCPYLQNLQQEHSQPECPYLSGTESNSSCPYLEKYNESQADCPYLDGADSSNCPYLKGKRRETIKTIIYYPLPEGKSS